MSSLVCIKSIVLSHFLLRFQQRLTTFLYGGALHLPFIHDEDLYTMVGFAFPLGGGCMSLMKWCYGWTDIFFTSSITTFMIPGRKRRIAVCRFHQMSQCAGSCLGCKHVTLAVFLCSLALLQKARYLARLMPGVLAILSHRSTACGPELKVTITYLHYLRASSNCGVKSLPACY
jgi:hypothetical protein